MKILNTVNVWCCFNLEVFFNGTGPGVFFPLIPSVYSWTGVW